MGNDDLATTGRARPSRPTGARRGRIALAAALLGIAVVGMVLGLSYYREVVAPGREWVVRIENETIMTTGQLARTIVVRELTSGNPSPGSELGRAPFVVADARAELELMRMAAPGMGLAVTENTLDVELRERFQPSSEATPDDESERLFRESYIRFLTERGISDEEYRTTVEADLLRERFVEAMGSVEALEEWFTVQRAERMAEVRVGSSQYAWVLDEVRASRPVTGQE